MLYYKWIVIWQIYIQDHSYICLVALLEWFVRHHVVYLFLVVISEQLLPV